MTQESTCKDMMKNAAPIMFGLIIMGAISFVIYSLLTHQYPSENKDQINSIIEFLKNAALIVVGFFFGSSASGKQNAEALSTIAQGATGTGDGAPKPPPINIPAAETVKVETANGDVNVTPTGG